jgi:hypothetical protein
MATLGPEITVVQEPCHTDSTAEAMLGVEASYAHRRAIRGAFANAGVVPRSGLDASSGCPFYLLRPPRQH